VREVGQRRQGSSCRPRARTLSPASYGGRERGGGRSTGDEKAALVTLLLHLRWSMVAVGRPATARQLLSPRTKRPERSVAAGGWPATASQLTSLGLLLGGPQAPPASASTAAPPASCTSGPTGGVAPPRAPVVIGCGGLRLQVHGWGGPSESAGCFCCGLRLPSQTHCLRHPHSRGRLRRGGRLQVCRGLVQLALGLLGS